MAIQRRTFAGIAGLGVGLPLLAACGANSNTGAAAQSSGTPTDSSTPTKSAAGKATKASKSPSAASTPSGTKIAATSDIAVGGGEVLSGVKVVVTQPTKGEFKGFSAVCTHAGCILADVTTTINCGCHGSQFSVTDGSVVQGPATTALPAVSITVSGTEILMDS
jgi:Rieske Fe-S protein